MIDDLMAESKKVSDFQAQVDHFYAVAKHARRHLRHIPLKPGFEARKLRPVGIQANAAETHAQRSLAVHLQFPSLLRGVAAATVAYGK